MLDLIYYLKQAPLFHNDNMISYLLFRGFRECDIPPKKMVVAYFVILELRPSVDLFGMLKHKHSMPGAVPQSRLHTACNRKNVLTNLSKLKIQLFRAPKVLSSAVKLRSTKDTVNPGKMIT